MFTGTRRMRPTSGGGASVLSRAPFSALFSHCLQHHLAGPQVPLHSISRVPARLSPRFHASPSDHYEITRMSGSSAAPPPPPSGANDAATQPPAPRVIDENTDMSTLTDQEIMRLMEGMDHNEDVMSKVCLHRGPTLYQHTDDMPSRSSAHLHRSW